MASVTAGQPYAGALEAIDRILNRESEPDEVLRQVMAILHERVPNYARVSLYLVEADELLLGPWAGKGPAGPTRLPVGEAPIGAAVDQSTVQSDNGVGAADSWIRARIGVPVLFEGQAVAAIGVDAVEPGAFGNTDRNFLERVAVLISAHCLVGWDTGGVPWSDVV